MIVILLFVPVILLLVGIIYLCITIYKLNHVSNDIPFFKKNLNRAYNDTNKTNSGANIFTIKAASGDENQLILPRPNFTNIELRDYYGKVILGFSSDEDRIILLVKMKQEKKTLSCITLSFFAGNSKTVRYTKVIDKPKKNGSCMDLSTNIPKDKIRIGDTWALYSNSHEERGE